MRVANFMVKLCAAAMAFQMASVENVPTKAVEPQTHAFRRGAQKKDLSICLAYLKSRRVTQNPTASRTKGARSERRKMFNTSLNTSSQSTKNKTSTSRSFPGLSKICPPAQPATRKPQGNATSKPQGAPWAAARGAPAARGLRRRPAGARGLAGPRRASAACARSQRLEELCCFAVLIVAAFCLPLAPAQQAFMRRVLVVKRSSPPMRRAGAENGHNNY